VTSEPDHTPGQIGQYDKDGYRTFTMPGDICLGCSDSETGVWVSVLDCAAALAIYDQERVQWSE